MRKILVALGAVAPLLLLTGAATAAQASPAHPASVKPMNLSPIQLGDADGTAGVYTQQFDQQFQAVSGTASLNPDNTRSILLGFSGAQGLQLCNASSGKVAQLGYVENPTVHTYTVGFVVSSLVPSDGIGGDPCDGNSILGFTGSTKVGNFTALGTVPVGDSVQLKIQVIFDHHGKPKGVQFTAEDATTGIANFQQYVSDPDTYFNEASAGVSTDLNVLGGPLSSDVGDFSGLMATNAAGIAHGFAFWTAVAVGSSGDAQTPWLLAPTTLSPAVVTKTWHPGHWHGDTWVPGRYTYTGQGASSFSLMSATPIGL